MTDLLAAQGPPLPDKTLPVRLDGQTDSFLIRLPAAIQARGCEVLSYQTGAFGGLGGHAKPPGIDRNTVTLFTGRDNIPARTLKAVVWCPGYGVALIDEPALEQSSRAIDLALTPLRNVEIAAKVLPAPDGRNLTGLEARVFYSAGWICGFFNLQDCGVPTWIVARRPIGVDGDLRFTVPDFAADSAIARVQQDRNWFAWGSGSFRLDVQPDRPPYRVYTLAPEGETRVSFGMIGVARQYPSVIMLRPHVR